MIPVDSTTRSSFGSMVTIRFLHREKSTRRLNKTTQYTKNKETIKNTHYFRNELCKLWKSKNWKFYKTTKINKFWRKLRQQQWFHYIRIVNTNCKTFQDDIKRTINKCNIFADMGKTTIIRNLQSPKLYGNVKIQIKQTNSLCYFI